MTRRELLTWPFCEVDVSHPHVTVDGTRITAEAAGCAADWHASPDSGCNDNYGVDGCDNSTKTSGAAAHTGALAALLVSASLALFV